MSRSIVLAYHSVSPGWPSTLAVTPEHFQGQLIDLVEGGWQGATFSQIVRGEAPDDAVAVTFDDGFRAVHEHAFPIMRELGLVGTIFVPTDYVGSERPMSWPGIEKWAAGDYADDLVPVDWDELRRMRAAGWEVGSHTRSHPHLTELDDERLAEELGGSREVCEARLGAPCDALAFPYGDVDARVSKAAESAGYKAAGSMNPGPEDPFCWPRVGVYPCDQPWRFRLKTSPAVVRIRASKLGRMVDDARLLVPSGGLPLADEASAGLIAI